MQMPNMCRAMDVVTAQLQHTYMHDAQGSKLLAIYACT